MKLKTRNGWLLTLALVAGIATFTATGAVYADEHGCKETWTPCGNENQGRCGFLHVDEGDFCVCKEGMTITPTCDCSTGEYPPCGGMEG
jgi:hypothetical protein